MTFIIEPAASPDQLRSFFPGIPEEDHAFFKEDITDERVVERLAGHGVVKVAVEHGATLAFASLSAGLGRSSHVADLRLVVAPDARRRGIGRALARQLLLEAISQGFLKITVDVPVANEAAIRMFVELGFEPEALLRGHLLDAHGGLVDVVVLSHFVEEQRASVALVGLQEELG